MEDRMPWDVEKGGGSCLADQFAVLDQDGNVVDSGCYDTRSEAEDRVAALYANAEDVAKTAEIAKAGGGELKRYWAYGEGAAKIGWGAPGDFGRCVRQVKEHMTKRQAKGLCNVLHRMATGNPPGEHGVGKRDEEPDMTKPDTLVAKLAEGLARLLGETADGGPRVSKDDVPVVGTSPTDMSMPVAKANGELGQVFGFAMFAEDPSNPGRYHVDHQGDWVTAEDLSQAVYKFVADSGDGGVMHKGLTEEFKRDVPATLIESMVFTPEKLEKMGLPRDAVPEGAWWLGYQVHDESVREAIKAGELGAFSIEGRARRVPSEPPA